MHIPKETARPAGTWASGQNNGVTLAQYDNHTASPQYDWHARWLDAIAELAREEAAARAWIDQVTSRVESILEAIAELKSRSRAAWISTNDLLHCRRTAWAAANEAGRLLGVHDEPRHIPLSVGEIRMALTTYQKVGATHLNRLRNTSDIYAAFLRADGSWEAAMFEENRPLQRLDDWEKHIYGRVWGC